MTCSCHYPISDLIYPSSYANISPFMCVFCMLMSAPGIVTHEIKQVGATVGGEVRMCKEINRKWSLPYSLLDSLSLCCLLPARKIPQGKLCKQVPSLVHLHQKCSYCVPMLSRFREKVLNNLLKYLMNSLRSSYSFYFSLAIFLNLHLLLCYSCFMFCFVFLLDD